MPFRDRIGDESVQEIIQEACERAKQLPHEDFHDPWPDRRSFSTDAMPINLGDMMQENPEEDDAPHRVEITYELYRDSKPSIVVWGHPADGANVGAAKLDIVRVAHAIHTKMLLRYTPGDALLHALDDVYPLRVVVMGLVLRSVLNDEGGVSTVSESWYV